MLCLCDEVAALVPAGRLHLETDAPWCGIRRTHAGHAHLGELAARWPEAKKEKWAADLCVKDRSEPCHIVQVLRVLARTRGVDEVALGAAAAANSERLFRLSGSAH